MLRLRKLELKDAPHMLEWMHDDTVVHDMQANFSEKTLSDCEKFIIDSLECGKNIHLAIVDDEDVYMGTVSLKNIDLINSIAEFAITVRKSAMGKGYAQYGTKEIIKIAFNKIKIKKVYWYVSKNNKRAIKFYEKIGATKIKDVNDTMLQTDFSTDSAKFNWYCVKQTNY